MSVQDGLKPEFVFTQFSARHPGIEVGINFSQQTMAVVRAIEEAMTGS